MALQQLVQWWEKFMWVCRTNSSILASWVWVAVDRSSDTVLPSYLQIWKLLKTSMREAFWKLPCAPWKSNGKAMQNTTEMASLERFYYSLVAVSLRADYWFASKGKLTRLLNGGIRRTNGLVKWMSLAYVGWHKNVWMTLKCVCGWELCWEDDIGIGDLSIINNIC